MKHRVKAGVIVLAALLFLMGGALIREGWVHVGRGTMPAGEASNGDYGLTEQYDAYTLKEADYKRHCYVGGAMLLMFGGAILYVGNQYRKEQN